MPLFTLPIAHTERHPASHASLKSILQKRKRSRHDDDGQGDEDSLPELSQDRALSAAQTNPLSLTPDEIVQYRTAGLALDELLPSVKDFPHRRLPRRKKRRDEDEDEDTEVEKVAAAKHERNYGLRLRHLGDVTVVLHCCLNEGDVPRASRAWQLLLRSEVGGKGVELRQSGYWGIGAELLIRQGEKRLKMNGRAENSDDEEQSRGIDESQVIEHVHGERRWGTQEGLVRAKDYYERLILEYPYKRQFASSVNGLDFWPAMLSCEVYGIQYTQRVKLQRISAREDSQEYEDADSDSDDMEDDEDEYTFSQRVEEKRRARKDERVWQERENVRLQTLAATQVVTARMDELMTSPPYSDSVQLLRLRAMLALYVSDLSVPGVLAGDMDEDDEDGDGDVAAERAEKRIERRQRRTNRDEGLKRLRKEKKEARKIFKKISELGGKGGGEAPVSVVEEEQMSD